MINDELFDSPFQFHPWVKIINGEVVQDEECDVDGASGAMSEGESESDVAEKRV